MRNIWHSRYACFSASMQFSSSSVLQSLGSDRSSRSSATSPVTASSFAKQVSIAWLQKLHERENRCTSTISCVPGQADGLSLGSSSSSSFGGMCEFFGDIPTSLCRPDSSTVLEVLRSREKDRVYRPEKCHKSAGVCDRLRRELVQIQIITCLHIQTAHRSTGNLQPFLCLTLSRPTPLLRLLERCLTQRIHRKAVSRT